MQFLYPDRSIRYVVRAVIAITCWQTICPVHATSPKDRPEFPIVAAILWQYFSELPGYKNGDLINRSQIEAVLKKVETTGWEIDDAELIVERGLPDSSFLAREFSTPAGKKFMRNVSSQPSGYSRLDRLSSIPHGERIVRDLIRRPGGSDMIAYLSTTHGGRSLGKMMGGVPNGVDLNKPTGRIYTGNDLLTVLKKLHDDATR